MPAPTLAPSPEADPALRALDELYLATARYRSSAGYRELLDFVRRFRTYSPYNAMLVHIQMPGAVYVAPPHRWKERYGRRIKPGARPLVILQPGGPVMFVFDVSDTEGSPLPPQVESPFEVRGAPITRELDRLARNARRDGVRIVAASLGAQLAGSIQESEQGLPLVFGKRFVRQRYVLELNVAHAREERFATAAHELAHLYCGHLGTPNPDWWPDRQNLGVDTEEFEAESAAYLVCRRLGIDAGSDGYLNGYLDDHDEPPPISLEAVLRSAGLIEQMARRALGRRRGRPEDA